MKPVLLFSGTNDRAVFAFCRYAERKGISLAIVANGADDLVFLSDYKNKVIGTREKNVLNWSVFSTYIDLVKDLFSCDTLFILPLTEYINRFLLENEVLFVRENVSFGLCGLELYSKISDKYDFGTLCQHYNITVPKEYVQKPSDYPYVIKPKAYFDGLHEANWKPALIYNEEQERTFLSSVDAKELYYQAYIGGRSIYLLFYFYQDESYSVYSQENFMQQHDGGSMVFSRSSEFHLKTDLVSPYVDLFLQEGFRGLVMVEVKLFNGCYYMIEANPRLWGPSQLILDAQMSLFDDFCMDNGLVDAPMFRSGDYLKNTPYFWSGGMVATQKRDASLLFYNYTTDDFLAQYGEVMSNEVYLRPDTLQIYLKEHL